MGSKADYFVAALWLVCLILDICNMTAGEQPSWMNLIMAHVCLILCNLQIGIIRKR